MDMALLHTLNAFALPLLLIVTLFLSARAFTTLTPYTQPSESNPDPLSDTTILPERN